MPHSETSSASWEVRCALSGEIARSEDNYEVKFPRSNGHHWVRYNYNFSRHPLRVLIAHYVFDGLEEVAAGTVNARLQALKMLGEFMSIAGASDLNPEVFSAFINWARETKTPDGERRFKESSVSTLIHNIKSFYRSGLDQQYPGWSQRELDSITMIARKVLHNTKERQFQESVEQALSLETFSDLARAVALEFGQCRQVWEARRRGERMSLYNLDVHMMEMIDPNPFVVLALLGAMRHGLRSSELNSLSASDLRVDNAHGGHELYVHAPDKADGYMPVDESFLLAWQFCVAWSDEARKLSGDTGEGRFRNALFVYLPTNYNRYPLVRFDTYSLSASHLPYFMKKWFDYKVVGEDGKERPLLHDANEQIRPLKLNYRKLRNAFAVRFAERERNRVTASRVLRHKSAHTTQKFYMHQDRLDHAKKVQIALRVEAQFVALGLKNAVVAGVSGETLRRAREVGAMTRHGICGSAIEGVSCRRASDCLECPHLMVLESGETHFLADRDSYLALAKRLDSEGDLRGAENARSRAKVCEAHLLRMNTIQPYKIK